MKKINDFDKIQENGSAFRRLPDGGYIVGIKTVADFPDRECLKLEIDICDGEYKNYFQKRYDDNKNEVKYWDAAGTLWRSYAEKSLPFFKGFITSVTKSNKGFEWNWDESKLKNRIFGVVIASKEVQGKNGKVYTNNYIDSVHSVEAIKSGNFTVPPLKKLEITEATNNAPIVDPFADVEPPKQEANNPFADMPNPFGDDNPWA